MPKVSKSNDGSENELDEDYRKKRDRNNEAVKRSRVKSKQKVQETESRVDELKVSNQVLEQNISNLSKELTFLKDLFMAQAQAKSEQLEGVDLKKILYESDEEEQTKGASTSKKTKANPSKSSSSKR